MNELYNSTHKPLADADFFFFCTTSRYLQLDYRTSLSCRTENVKNHLMRGAFCELMTELAD